MAAKKVIKRVVLVVVAIIIVIIVALGIFVSTFDVNKYKPTVEQKVSAAVGYNLKIDGDLGLSIFPSIAIEVKGLHLENPEKFTAQAKDFVFVEKANVGLALFPLLSKRLEFKDITLQGVNLNLVKPKEGAPNWDLNANKKQVDAIEENDNAPQTVADDAKSGDSHAKIAALLNSLSFNEFAVKNTRVMFYDLAADKTQNFDNINFTCGPFNGADKPLKFDFSARMNNTPLAVKGQLTSLNQILNGAAPFNVDASFDKLKAHVEGTFAAAGDPMLEATFTVPAFNPKDVIKALMPTVPDIIAKSGSNAFAKLEATQKITVSKDKVITFSGPYTFDQTSGEITGGFNNGVIQVKISGNQLSPGMYMPSQAVLQKLSVSGLNADAKVDKGVISANFNTGFTLDGSKGTVSGTYAKQGETQTIVANLNADRINLNTLMPQKAASTGSSSGSGGSAGGAKASSGIPAPSDIFGKGALAKMNLTANVKLNQALYQDITVSGLTATAKLNKGYADASFSGNISKGDLKGNASGSYNSKNNIHNVNVTADIPELNLDTLMGGSKTASTGSGSAGGGTAPKATAAKKPILDPVMFNKLNVAANVKLNKLIFKGLTFSGTSLNAKLNQGATDAAFNAKYGNASLNGTFKGNLTAQSSQKALTFKSNSLPIEPFMKAFMNKDLLAGALTADINVTGNGMDIDDFKRSLTGQVSANIGSGQIKVGPGLGFSSIVVDMPFNNGKGDIKKGSMTGNVISADLTGWINLNNDTLDVTLTPTQAMPVEALASIIGLGLPSGLTTGISAKIPFRVHGSFSSPSFDWAQSLGNILENLDSESLKQFDLDNIQENLKQDVGDKLDEVLPGAGGLVEGLFGGSKNKNKTGNTTNTATTTTTDATQETSTVTPPVAEDKPTTTPAVTEETKPAAPEETKPTVEETKPAATEEAKPAPVTEEAKPAATEQPTAAPAQTEQPATEPEPAAEKQPEPVAEPQPAPSPEPEPVKETPAPVAEPAPTAESPAETPAEATGE